MDHPNWYWAFLLVQIQQLTRLRLFKNPSSIYVYKSPSHFLAKSFSNAAAQAKRSLSGICYPSIFPLSDTKIRFLENKLFTHLIWFVLFVCLWKCADFRIINCNNGRRASLHLRHFDSPRRWNRSHCKFAFLSFGILGFFFVQNIFIGLFTYIITIK